MPIAPPIRLRQLAEAFIIEYRNGIAVAYVYFDDDASRRRVNKRPSKAEAEEAAKIMAGAIRKTYSR